MIRNAVLKFVLFLSIFSNTLKSEEEYQIIPDQSSVSILTPSYAEYKTLKLKLQNGLEAYIVSDPKTSKSGATLVVQTGSWSEPTEYPGLAHFLEHMLFLGTKKYPVESEYDSYIKEHNGESNAYTAPDHTLYLFTVNNDAFKEALDRFSSFFKEPLFNPSGVSRELQAIDQEFAKNFTDDDFRSYYVDKELSNPLHPYHSFSSGNASTLSKVSQHVLKNWYETHYSANIMHLIVYSPLPIETLKHLVVTDFKDIPNIHATPVQITVPLTSATMQKSIVYIEPLKNVRELSISWELPTKYAHMYETRPSDLICHILGHEGPGSLLELLKRKELAESIECSGAYYSGDTYILSMTVYLTEKGLQEKYKVLEDIFGAISAIKQQGIPLYFFDEIKKIDTLAYEYKSREEPFNYLMKMGEWMIRENLNTFPEHSSIIQKYDPVAIQNLLNDLTIDNANISLLAKSEYSEVKTERKEKWMGVPYAVKIIPPEEYEFLQKISPNSAIHIPAPNPFIPHKISFSSSSVNSEKPLSIPHPEAIVNTNEGVLYFAKDIDLQLPQTVWFFQIHTPRINSANPSEMALSDLYIRCLKEILNPLSYNAKIADLIYDISQIENGIEISLYGYQDNAETLFDALVEKLKKCQPTKEQFALFKDSLLRQYQNFQEESPLKQSLEVFQQMIYQNYSTHKQKAEALAKISFEQFLDYLKDLFEQTYTKGLIYGNIEREQALRLWSKLKTTLSTQPYLNEKESRQKVIILPQKTGPYFLEETTKASGNALLLGLEDPDFSFQKRAAQQILSKAMSGPFYATLRTKQQTGYIVYNHAEELEKRLFSLFAVQSNTHAPRDLLARFELFIEDFLQTGLSQEQFNIIRESLLAAQEQPPQNILDMGTLLKTLAFKYEGDFDWISKRIKGFKELTFEEFQSISQELMGKENKRRLAVLIEGTLPSNQTFEYHPLKNSNEIKILGP